jgi:chromosome segregation ATPase
MSWLPFVTRRRYTRDLATKQALLDEARDERDGARTGRDYMARERDDLARQLADSRARADRLSQQLAAVEGRRLESGDAVSRLERRLKALQDRYDQAVGLGRGRIEDSAPWQPGREKPKEATK